MNAMQKVTALSLILSLFLFSSCGGDTPAEPEAPTLINGRNRGDYRNRGAGN
jgi:hypothetical protein